MSDPFDFQGAIVALAEARDKLTKAKKELIPYEIKHGAAKSEEKDLYDLIRAKAVEEYTEDRVSSPHEAVTIRELSQKNWDTPENVKNALIHDPESLYVDSDAFKDRCNEIGELVMRLAIETHTSEQASDGVKLAQLLLECLHFKAGKGFGEPYWAKPIVTLVPTAYVQTNLGEYLINTGE